MASLVLRRPSGSRRREQLEGNVVRVAERQAGAIGRVEDLAMRDAELVQPLGPVHELVAAGDAERHVVEARPALVEAAELFSCGKPCRPRSVPPIEYTMCRNGPVSSSRTGGTPRISVYQASLTARSVTVRATWVIAGIVAVLGTLVLLLLCVVVVIGCVEQPVGRISADRIRGPRRRRSRRERQPSRRPCRFLPAR